MTVRLQTQGRGECWLAAACMLADYPLERIRREIIKKFGYSWTEMISTNRLPGAYQRREDMSAFVVERTGVSRKLLELNWSRGDAIRRGPAPRLRIPEGRGVLMLIRGPRRPNFGCHVVVYDGGRVYDPMGSVYDAGTFDQHYRGWRIDKAVKVAR